MTPIRPNSHRSARGKIERANIALPNIESRIVEPRLRSPTPARNLLRWREARIPIALTLFARPHPPSRTREPCRQIPCPVTVITSSRGLPDRVSPRSPNDDPKTPASSLRPNKLGGSSSDQYTTFLIDAAIRSRPGQRSKDGNPKKRRKKHVVMEGSGQGHETHSKRFRRPSENADRSLGARRSETSAKSDSQEHLKKGQPN